MNDPSDGVVSCEPIPLGTLYRGQPAMEATGFKLVDKGILLRVHGRSNVEKVRFLSMTEVCRLQRLHRRRQSTFAIIGALVGLAAGHILMNYLSPLLKEWT